MRTWRLETRGYTPTKSWPIERAAGARRRLSDASERAANATVLEEEWDEFVDEWHELAAAERLDVVGDGVASGREDSVASTHKLVGMECSACTGTHGASARDRYVHADRRYQRSEMHDVDAGGADDILRSSRRARSTLNAHAAFRAPPRRAAPPPRRTRAIDVDARHQPRHRRAGAGRSRPVEIRRGRRLDGAVAACWGAKVSVNYRASFENGTFFDVAHRGRSSPLEAQLDGERGLIDGLQKGIQSMRKAFGLLYNSTLVILKQIKS